MTLRSVARRSGIDPGHLSKVERGEKQLSLESLHRLAVVLGLNELATLLRPYVLDNGDTTGNDDGTGSSHPAPPLENEPIHARSN